MAKMNSGWPESGCNKGKCKDYDGVGCFDGVVKDLDYFKQHPQEAIGQLRFCGFECEAGDLEDNVAFQAIVEFVNFAAEKLSNQKQKDVVQQPEHYRQGKYELIDEMLIVFGPQKTFDFCILNSWKYRARAPYKDKMEEDMKKSSRYLEYAKQIVGAYEDVGFGSIRLIKEDRDE